MSSDWLEIKGIKQNNLKNISIKLPHNKVIAVTGLSGSGKSSLAFDTIFAEGQWRFIESLASYARLFLEKLDRPDIEEIRNIRPTIALEQRNPIRGSRSTVGTLTDIYDILRVLYSKVSTPFCLNCGIEIKKWNPTQVYKELINNYSGSKALILFESNKSISQLRKEGFYRLFIEGEVKEVFDFDNNLNHKHEIVLDRLVIRDETRLSDSIELAWREGNGRVKLIIIEKGELVFSDKNSCDKCGTFIPEPMPILFSFNHPIGACPECKGFGNILKYDESLIVPDTSLSILEGAIEPWEKPSYKWWKTQLLNNAKRSGIDIERPFKYLEKEDRQKLYEGNGYFYGLNNFFESLQDKRYKLHVRVFISRYRNPFECPLCRGKKLKNEVLSYKIGKKDISEISQMSIDKLYDFFFDPPFTSYQKEASKEPLRQILSRLEFLKRVGLDYLTLDRQAMTLSGGEHQRVNLTNQLSARLSSSLYILDEPTIGLHSRDNKRIAQLIKELSEQGNTILVVEHDPEIIKAADWVIELGPGGGHKGGKVVFNGSIDDFLKSDTITAKYLNTFTIKYLRKNKSKIQNRQSEILRLTGACGHNLKNLIFTVPLNRLTVVSGVSGSGKSTIVVDTLYMALKRHFNHSYKRPLEYKSIEGIENIKDVKLVDQSPIGRSPRSNPATYLKIFASIRKIYSEQLESKIHGYEPGFFSFNIQGGRCETCKGEGYQKLEMYFFEDLFVKCEECLGKRYRTDTLRIKYKGYSISDVLDMTVEEAIKIFSDEKAVVRRLELMKDVGLGYLRIGQAATTLSGGEAQRIKICSELGLSKRNGLLYIFDEPTIGLHMHDIDSLIDIFKKLVELGNSVIIIEHNLAIIKAADWAIDLGPEGGDKGGEIIFEGTPEDLSKRNDSYTGISLSQYV